MRNLLVAYTKNVDLDVAKSMLTGCSSCVATFYSSCHACQNGINKTIKMLDVAAVCMLFIIVKMLTLDVAK